VLVAHGIGCPLLRKSVPALRALRDRYAPRGVAFLLINPDGEERAALQAEAEAYGIDLPILDDAAQIVTAALGLTRTAEAVVLAAPGFGVAYRGAISDQFGYESTRSGPERPFLAEALEAVLAGRTPQPGPPARGCLIHFEDPGALTYTADVAPLLSRRCVPCHSPGGVAPWSMDRYQKVRRFGDMIREVVRTRRMPPWHADPHHGSFRGQAELSLPPAEARTLVRWVERGMVRGDGPDPLLTAPRPRPGAWALGEPDRVLRLAQEQEVPAQGPDLFRGVAADQAVEQDLWLRAVEIQPGNPRAVHHANLFVLPPSGTSIDEMEGRVIAGYAPGVLPLALPPDTGIFVPRGARLRFVLHYQVTGRPERDRTRAGLYLHRRRPRHDLTITILNQRQILIPPGARDVRLGLRHVLDQGGVLLGLQPHMHYRGVSARFTAHLPDGRSEILLSVPRYRFNWQRIYQLDRPRRLPPGTAIEFTGTYDNSAQNPDNPDPTRHAVYGPNSQAEMFTAALFYITPDK
jgi:hypothetical protein